MSVINTEHNNTDRSKASTEAKEENDDALMRTLKPTAIPFKNQIGDQNSYFIVIMHFFHFTKEINEFISKANFNNDKNYIILQKLKELLKQYDDLLKEEAPIDEDHFLNVAEMRKEIETLFLGEGFFKMGKSGEPADLLFFFLNAFHSYSMESSSLKYSISQLCSPLCPSHSNFMLNIVKQYECKGCGAQSDAAKFENNYYIYEIGLKKIMEMVNSSDKLEVFRGKFFSFLQEINSKTDGKCPSNCKNPIMSLQSILMEINPYLIFNLSWKEISPKLIDICNFFFSLPQTFNNNDLFKIFDRSMIKPYSLFGLITYCSGQFSCFFKGSHGWTYMNDDKIVLMKNYKELIVHCIKTHSRPTMLFYHLNKSKLSTLEEETNSISDKEYLALKLHCTNVDKEQFHEVVQHSKSKSKEGLGKRGKGAGSKLRPDILSKKITDIRLVKSIQNLQKAGTRMVDGATVTEGAAVEEEEEEEEEEEKKIMLRKNEWLCTYEDCGNINSTKFYQCSRCKSINIDIYNIIMNKKTKKSKVQSSTKSKEEQFGMLNKTYMKRERTETNRRNSTIGTKKGVKFKTEEHITTSKKNNEEQQEKDEHFRMYTDDDNSKNVVVFQIKDDQSWRCPYCNFRNEECVFFCEKCKRNIPQKGEKVQVDNTDEKEFINGIKQYKDK